MFSPSTLFGKSNKIKIQLWSSFKKFLASNSSINKAYSQHDDYLKLVPAEGDVPMKLPYVWLRDHCRCSDCYSYETNQRNFDMIDLDGVPKDVQIDQQSVRITWQDNHETNFDVNWLRENSPGTSVKEAVQKMLWDKETIKREMPEDVPYEEFMKNDESLKSILMNIYKYGLGIVKGCPTTEEKTVEVAERIGHIRNTFYGKSWAFTNDAAFADSSYSNEGIGPHHDTTYLLEPSGIQVFHCLYHDGSGGENLLVDGFNAAENLRMKHPDFYKALLRIPIHGKYYGESHMVKSTINILNENMITKQLESVRYNPFDRGDLTNNSFEDTQLFYKSLHALSAEINSPLIGMWLKLTPGQVLFVDNWRVLHGRAAFDGKRVMAGCYIPKDELNSRLRAVADLNVY